MCWFNGAVMSPDLSFYIKYNKTKRDKLKIPLNLLPTDCGLKPECQFFS